MRLGKNITKAGQKVININVTIINKMNGKIATDSFSIVIFAIPQAIYKHVPTGGVTNPIIKLKTTITPKCTGLIPISKAVGNKIGTKIIMPEP